MDVSSIAIGAALPVSETRQIPPEQAAQRRELVKAAGVINQNQAVGPENELVIVFDRVSHRPVTQVLDRKTKEVVMQVPFESVLRLAQSLSGSDSSG